MLDQNVPNPLAKNPNVHTHKVFAAVGLILIGVVILAAVIWYFAIGRFPAKTETTTSTTQTVKQNTTSTKSASVDPTADWKTYTNSSIFTLKYPNSWVYTDSTTNNLCSDNSVFFAPSESLLGKCASGFGGLIAVGNASAPDTTDTIAAQYNSADYTDFQKTNTTVGGKAAIKISGISQKVDEIADSRGTKTIVYIVGLENQVLIISYNQSKNWDDHSTEFEQMIGSMKFL